MNAWKVFNITTYVITFALLALLIHECNTKPKVITEREVVYQTSTDTVYLTKTVYVPKYKPVYVKIVDTVYASIIDTQSIIDSYYNIKNYKDTINLDVNNESVGFVIIDDRISMNELQSRNAKWNVNMPISVAGTNYPVSGWYTGLDVGISKGQLSNASFSILHARDKNVYKLGIGMQAQESVRFFIDAGIYFKIH